jgi:hypothetical protein
MELSKKRLSFFHPSFMSIWLGLQLKKVSAWESLFEVPARSNTGSFRARTGSRQSGASLVSVYQLARYEK